jgi:hypothetical protein
MGSNPFGSTIQNKKGHPLGWPFSILENARSSRRFGFGRRLFGFRQLLFTFQVTLPAFAIFNFIVLFAHKCLYFVRVLRFCGLNMKVCALRFNIYLVLATALGLLCGCQSEKPKQNLAALRVHIEASPIPAGSSQTVSVLRSNPVLVTIAIDPVLTEANIIAARIIESPGGFSVEVKFDETGTWILEQYSASNVGRHFAIFGQWGEKLVNGRWLAAPLISHRIGDGVLAFTSDTSRDEAEQLVLGLNHVAKNINKAQLIK